MAQATETTTKTAAAVADPSTLGLFGFATTTLVLSAWNAGFSGVTPGGALGLALAFGGLGQLLAGMWEFKNGNTFGGVAFSSYGAFWISFWVLFNAAGSAPKGKNDVAWYLLGWTIVTFLYFVCSIRLNYGLVAVFLLLFLTFLLLCLGAFNGNAAGSGITSIGGWVGIVTAVAAYYVGTSNLMKAVGADLLPNPSTRR